MMPIAATTPPTAQPRKRSSTHHAAAWLLAAAACTLPMWGTLGNAHSQTTAAQRNSGRLSVTLPGQTQAQILYEESHALVIGASAYRNGWVPLKGVKDDVVAVKAALERAGYAVHTVSDPTRDELDKALRDFLHQYGQKRQNRLLVYFAGHGETLDVGAIGKVGYIVPVDAPNPAVDEAGFKQKAYDMEMIETHAKSINAKHALFVFDSCFAGTIFDKRRGSNGPPPFIAEMATRPVQQFITSGDANQTVPDKSIFREQFIKALETREADLNDDDYITGTELGMYLQTTVINRAQNSRERSHQTPMFGKSRISALSEGDFVFASLRVEPSGQPPTRPPLPGPAQGSGLSLEALEREEATRKEWAQWQARMKADFDKTAAFKGSADLQAKAWERFLAAWGQDNPLSGEDEGLRVQAQGRMQERQQEAQRLAAAAQAPAPVTPAPTAPTLAAQPARPGQAFRDCTGAHCPELVVIPAGSFVMGSNDGYGDEKPPHSVSVRSFALGKYEVTQGQWKAVMGSNPSLFKNCGDNCPVERVSWNDIQQYLVKLNNMTGMKYRLASEAEWEYAARAGCSTAFNVGGQCRDKIEASEANFNGNYTYNGSVEVVFRDKTIQVGSFGANNWGLHDMHGNVWEWVQDCYQDNYGAGQPSDGSAHRGNDSSCSRRVLRGGAWKNDPVNLRSAGRNAFSPDFRYSNNGFRIARTVP